MNCLIVAAGHGSRIRPRSESKPLTPVAGVPLIERVIAAAAEGGATAFTVVTGYRADLLEPFLADLAKRAGLAIASVHNVDFDKPNGHSVLAGAERIPGDYLLLMADHLVEPGLVSRAITSYSRQAGVLLMVDRRIANPSIDLADATKVRTRADGAILAIGKDLASYEAIDTGVFVASPMLATGIRSSLAQGNAGSLSEGVQWLADRGLAWTADIGESWWLDVDDARAVDLAEAELGRKGGRERVN